MKITLVAPTYKRPDVCNRLLHSLPPDLPAVIVCLSGTEGLTPRPNTIFSVADQMPLTNALNHGAAQVSKFFPDTDVLLLTDDDVYFCDETVLGENVFSLLRQRDTGAVGITRIIHNKTPSPGHIEQPFVYKGGGYMVRRDVFDLIGGYTPGNSVDEWDICIRLYLHGFRNYRTRTAYAYHKQGSAGGGYRAAVKEGTDIGHPDAWLLRFVDGHFVHNSGYGYLDASSKVNAKARALHNQNNDLISAGGWPVRMKLTAP